ncbi:uncharacterized protein LOC115228422 [Octopus sinensis]|uniref:Uncharacterized protein LOC115228422 n=1 Tax=Octopus sinensis TaxID=2607531 RepID=A0A6P7TSY9_9MOLL|nr:uncharacterized protein LOC115228422 [Octopus sinensis]
MDKLANTFEKSFLKINTEKTEYTIVRRCDERHKGKWRHTKKFGTLLGDTEDMIRRKSLATFALKRLNNIWLRGKKISASLKIKLYNMFVKPVLLYNSSSWALTVQEMKNLNSFHRMQLKYILGIFWPKRISNKHLYSRYNAHPLDEEIRCNRWGLFGHILRMDRKTHANLAMEHHYAPHPGTNFRGRPRITLPTLLHQDLTLIGKRLKSADNLEHLRELSRNRGTRKRLTKRIQKRVAQAR